MSDEKKGLRNYGMPDCGEPLKPPKATVISTRMMCPNCGCTNVMSVEVLVSNKLLRGGVGLASYLGCPACPWASPAMVAATLPGQSEGEA